MQQTDDLSHFLFMASIDINVDERAHEGFPSHLSASSVWGASSSSSPFSASSSPLSESSVWGASSSSSPLSASSSSSSPLTDFSKSLNNKGFGGVKESSGYGFYAGSKCVSLKNKKQHKTTPKNIIRKGTKKHYRKKNKTIKK